jgi:hypothetical protein
MHSYENKNQKTINLEIYEMENPASAYGIYTFRSSERGKEISIGNEGLIEGYYLNFWKGNFLVTVIGFDSDEETLDGIKTIARAVEVRIKEEGSKPHMTSVLLEEDLKPNGIKYLRGNLALYNNYNFDSANIFGLTEGVLGTYENHRIFLFSYKNETESVKWFEDGMSHLKKSPKFHDLTLYENGVTLQDENDNHLRFEIHNNFIIVVLGAVDSTTSIMERQKNRIDRSR